MMISKDTGEKSFFKKLSANEIKLLRKKSTVDKLQPGDVLLKEGDRNQKIYLILSGKIQIMKGLNSLSGRATTLGEGEWISEITFTKEVEGTGVAVAAEPTSIVAVDKTIIESLEEKTQLIFYKQLSQISSERAGQLSEIAKNLAKKNARLMDDIFTERAKAKTDFRHMEMIRGIINKIPRLPAFATTLSLKLSGDKLSASQVAEEVMKDPSLVGIVLKTINSAYYGLEQKISDMQYAIVLLGFDMMYQLVIAEGVKRTMPDTPVFKELHSHSVIISQISSILSQELEIGDPAEMATIGLLHDLGQTVIQLLKEKNPTFSGFINILDRAQMGALLLKTWNLPDRLWQSVEFQFYPEFSTPENIPTEVRNNVSILYIAHLCYDMLRSRPEGELPVTFLEGYLRTLNWKGGSMDDILKGKLLPALQTKIKTSPAPMKYLLKQYVKQTA